MMVWPTVTWPSPAITTRPRWRTERMVVLRSSGPGVRLVIRLHEAPEVDVRVALRGGEARVPEQLLDGAEVGAAAEQVGGEGVAERVRRRLRRRAARGDVALHQAGDAAAREPAAARVPEDRPRRHRQLRLGAGGAVGVERAQRGTADGNDALLPALAEDADGRRLAVDRLPVETRELAHAEARGVEELEHRAVALAAQPVGARRREETVDLVERQVRGQLPASLR